MPLTTLPTEILLQIFSYTATFTRRHRPVTISYKTVEYALRRSTRPLRALARVNRRFYEIYRANRSVLLEIPCRKAFWGSQKWPLAIALLWRRLEEKSHPRPPRVPDGISRFWRCATPEPAEEKFLSEAEIEGVLRCVLDGTYRHGLDMEILPLDLRHSVMVMYTFQMFMPLPPHWLQGSSHESARDHSQWEREMQRSCAFIFYFILRFKGQYWERTPDNHHFRIESHNLLESMIAISHSQVRPSPSLITSEIAYNRYYPNIFDTWEAIFSSHLRSTWWNRLLYGPLEFLRWKSNPWTPDEMYRWETKIVVSVVVFCEFGNERELSRLRKRLVKIIKAQIGRGPGS